MEEFDFMSTDNIAQDLMDIKETARKERRVVQSRKKRKTAKGEHV